MIATDLDGTLLHSSGVVTERNRLTLDRARRAGLEIAICTGRRHSYAMRAVRSLHLPPHEAVISSNGVVTRLADGALLWRSTLSADLVRRMCTALHEFRNALVLTFDRSGAAGEDAPGALVLEELDCLQGSIRSWMEVNAASIRRVSPIERVLGSADSGEPIQAMLCGGMERMHRAEELLQQQFSAEVDTYRTEYPGRDLCILDIVPKGKSKATAMLRFAARRGIAADEILAIGDNWNDEPMLRAAARSVVLANAPHDLLDLARSQGWQIGLPGDEDGFTHAVEQALAEPAPPLN